MISLTTVKFYQQTEKWRIQPWEVLRSTDKPRASEYIFLWLRCTSGTELHLLTVLPPPHPSCFTFLRHKNSMLRDALFHTVYCTIAAITVACILSFQLYAPYWLLTDVDGQTGPHRPARQTDHVYRNASLPWKDKKSFATSVSLLRQQYTWNAPMKVHSSDCPFQSQSGQINQDAVCVGSQHL